MGRKGVFIREFKCPKCGALMYAPKKRQDKLSHIKTMWCWGCKAVRDFEMTGTTTGRRKT